MRKITFTHEAYSDYLYWLETDKKQFIKITKLIREVLRNPEKGIGKPEQLKHQYKGCWSRRISEEHRLIYTISETAIEIISCKYHYQ
jgi:toxin YoeB